VTATWTTTLIGPPYEWGPRRGGSRSDSPRTHDGRFESRASGHERRMADKRKPEEIEAEELESQDGEELPDREVMSLVSPDPVIADPVEGITFPVEGEPGDRF
jgi:hypothetical protein